MPGFRRVLLKEGALNFSVENLVLTNGASLSFQADDIVLVVGQNSSGKSTFLRDIRSCLRNHREQRKIISEANFRCASKEELEQRVKQYYYIAHVGSNKYVANRDGTPKFYLGDLSGGPKHLSLDQAAGAFITLLNSEGRLALSRPVETLDVEVSKADHPFQTFVMEPMLLAQSSALVERAFGLSLAVNRIGNPIRGYVGANLPTSDTVSNDKDLPKIAERLEIQGDGLRSYAGIISEVVALSHPVVLIDEPEAFLHPPQAKRLGKSIVESLGSNRQAFVATHNSNFLQGALARLSSRLRVLRLQRSATSFSVVDIAHVDLKQAETLPSIANSNLLDSLFYDQTVICEADADCKLFERIISDEQCERFWFSAGGKQQFVKIASLLSRFGVDWRAVLDLDAILNWDILESLALLKGLDISPYKAAITSALKQVRPPDYAAIRDAAMSALQADKPDEDLVRDAQRALETRKTSSPLKQSGLTVVPKGQEREDVEKFLALLASNGILLLKAGELESYVGTVGGHGPAWVNTVLERQDEFRPQLDKLSSELSTGLS